MISLNTAKIMFDPIYLHGKTVNILKDLQRVNIITRNRKKLLRKGNLVTISAMMDKKQKFNQGQQVVLQQRI